MPAVLRLRDDTIAWKEADGEVLLLDLATSTYLAVNPSATLLWRLLADGTTNEALTRALADAYGLSDDDAASDVAAFLDDCRQRGLVEDGAERA